MFISINLVPLPIINDIFPIRKQATTTMVQQDHPSITTRLQSRIDVQDEKIEIISNQEALGSLYQDAEVEDDIKQLEALSALIPNQSKEQSIGLFLHGLHLEIRNWVRRLNSVTCDATMGTARQVAVATRIVEDEIGPGGSMFSPNLGGFSLAWKMISSDPAQDIAGPHNMLTHLLSPSISPVLHFTQLGAFHALLMYTLLVIQTHDTCPSKNGSIAGERGFVSVVGNATPLSTSASKFNRGSCLWLKGIELVMMEKSTILTH